MTLTYFSFFRLLNLSWALLLAFVSPASSPSFTAANSQDANAINRAFYRRRAEIRLAAPAVVFGGETTKNTSLKQPVPGWPFSITTTTAGRTFSS